MVIRIAVNDKWVAGSRPVAGTHIAISALVVFPEQVLVEQMLHQQAIRLAHAFARCPGRECGVVRPQPEIIPIDLVHFVAADTDIQVLLGMLLHQQLPGLGYVIIGNQSQPDQV